MEQTEKRRRGGGEEIEDRGREMLKKAGRQASERRHKESGESRGRISKTILQTDLLNQSGGRRGFRCWLQMWSGRKSVFEILAGSQSKSAKA